jgi:hypothetical protein
MTVYDRGVIHEYSSRLYVDNDRLIYLGIGVRMITAYGINMIYGTYYECTSRIFYAYS